MKTKLLFSLAAMMLLSAHFVTGQNKIAIRDKAEFMNEGIETALQDRLKTDSMEIATMIDTRKPCEYWYMSLQTDGDDLSMQVLDCKDKLAGIRNLGSRIFSATDQEKGLLIYFGLAEIIKNPSREQAEADPQPEKQAPAAVLTGEPGVTVINPDQHRSRYFFAPSSLSLEKGELYYNSLYFLVHDVQFGVSSNFSIGLGTTVSGFPFYITPKATIPLNEKNHLAIGDLMMLGTWGADFFGNLLYLTYTRGDANSNLTLGLGHLFVGTGELTYNTNAPVFNVSGLGKVSDHIYFITENYISQVKTRQLATYSYYNEGTQEYIYREEYFSQKLFFIYGLTGFRIINKVRDVVSWQFGLSYVFTSFGEVPRQYTYANWNTEARQGSNFIAFPVIGYARKFSTRY